MVTSPTGAAIRDFLEVLRRRWRGVHVLILPTRVQGEGAASEIVAGIQAAQRIRPAIDVLVVTRGGGSLEDLWPFHEEKVVRAIAACSIPVVSAVGHEIDVTLSDLVADVRALTPSEAAERVLPAASDVEAIVCGQGQRIDLAMRRRLDMARARVDAVAAQRSLRRPFEHLRDRARRLDELSIRALQSVRSHARKVEGQLATLAGKLDTLSPLGVLSRGYSVTQRTEDGTLVRAADALQPGESITTRFVRGTATSVIDSVDREA